MEKDSNNLNKFTPIYCVWEITLACNLICRHCGSSAGFERSNELSTGECFQIINELAALGTREITFIGGEFLLRPDWELILQANHTAGINSLVVSNGFSITKEVADKLRELDVKSVSISLDGGGT